MEKNLEKGSCMWVDQTRDFCRRFWLDMRIAQIRIVLCRYREVGRQQIFWIKNQEDFIWFKMKRRRILGTPLHFWIVCQEDYSATFRVGSALKELPLRCLWDIQEQMTMRYCDTYFQTIKKRFSLEVKFCELDYYFDYVRTSGLKKQYGGELSGCFFCHIYSKHRAQGDGSLKMPVGTDKKNCQEKPALSSQRPRKRVT